MGKEWSKQIIDMITETIPSGDGKQSYSEVYLNISSKIRPKAYKYPNLYTDLSSSFAKGEFRDYFRDVIMKSKDWERLRDRILFGTDWYMTFLYTYPLIGKDFWQYCETTKDFLDKLDPGLWPRFTQYNPYRFYRLGMQIDRIAKNIIVKRGTREIKEKLKKSIDETEITRIHKEAAWIKVANQPHVIYEETP